MKKDISVKFNKNHKESWWEVNYKGDPTPFKYTQSLDDAIKVAKEKAKKDGTNLFIYNMNGDMQYKYSYK